MNEAFAPVPSYDLFAATYNDPHQATAAYQRAQFEAQMAEDRAKREHETREELL